MQPLNAFRIGAGRSELPGLVQHVFLIASRARPPIVHHGHALQTMHLVMMDANDLSLRAAGAIGPLPALPPLQVLMRPAAAAPSLVPREITGEILRDARGRLYEMVGDQVRPVNQLCRNAHGQVIDLLPARAPSADQPSVEVGATGADHEAATRPDSSTPERTFREMVRRLAPEPGFWRVVRFADFIDAITPQLAAAQRLQPGHRLACYVQVYELCVRTSIAALEQCAARELGAAGKLVPLSYELCRKFGLSLPRPAFALAATPASNSPGVVCPGSRFVSLRVAIDPTAAASSTASASASTEEPFLRAAPPANTKTSIPDEFGQPWKFCHSRVDVVHDMNRAATRGAIRCLIQRMFGGVSAHDMEKWQSRLNGKTVDQQLWGVKPPHGAFDDPRIRGWVAQALQFGGYDVSRMQVEWEIHWRRQLS